MKNGNYRINKYQILKKCSTKNKVFTYSLNFTCFPIFIIILEIYLLSVLIFVSIA